MLYEQAAQLLNHAEKSLAFLLDQHASEQSAERAHIPAQGQFLGRIAGSRAQLGQAVPLIIFTPQGRLGHGTL
jgi:hypothetical protein